MAVVAVTGWLGSGVPGDPFRPDIDVDDQSTSWGVIDLRPDQTVADGLCIVVLPNSITVSAKVGQLREIDWTAPLTLLQRQFVANRLNVDPSTLVGMTIGQAALQLLGNRIPAVSGRRKLQAMGITLADEAG